MNCIGNAPSGCGDPMSVAQPTLNAVLARDRNDGTVCVQTASGDSTRVRLFGTDPLRIQKAWLRQVLMLLPMLAACCCGAQGHEGSWARLHTSRISRTQVGEARRWGIPVAFTNGVGMRFVLVPAGTFQMGSPPSQPGHHEGETLHEVVHSKPFYIQATEVSNQQYRLFRRDHSSGSFDGCSMDLPDQPAADVDWDGAAEFAAWMSARDPRRTYRLPTEAEWEYACRAGARTAFSWGDSPADAGRYANVADRTARRVKPRWTSIGESDDGHFVTAPVGSLLPNAWGVHDMHGNVWEWCSDWYGAYEADRHVDPTGPRNYGLSPVRRVLRGGSWARKGLHARCASRSFADFTNGDVSERGFRLVVPLHR